MSPIQYLYQIFSIYNTIGIHHCNCGCIDEEKVKQLYKQQLSVIDKDTLSYYHGSALYTWGDIEHYKYYLPRICELIYKDKNNFYVSIEDLAIKLQYAHWGNWAANERKAIADFVAFDCENFLNNTTDNLYLDDFAAYLNFLSLEHIFALWHIENNNIAMRKFVNFIYDYGQEILHGKLIINHINYQSNFLDFLRKGVWHLSLEKAFFEHANKDENYAEKISIVLQMLENL